MLPPWLGWAVEVLVLWVAVYDAGQRPRPMAVAGKSVVSSSWAKHVVTAASWCSANWGVVSGGSSRRR